MQNKISPTGLVKAFEDLAIFVKTRPWATVAAVVFLMIMGVFTLALFYGYVTIKKIDSDLTHGVEILEESHTTKAQLQEDFQNSVEENALIDIEMTKLVFKHGIDAMLVFKFHNSRTDLQGKHDFFYSATNEVSHNGVVSYLPDAQAIPIVRLGRYITPMIEGKCQVTHVATMAENDWLRGKLELQGIETLVACPIYDNQGNLLGFTELIYVVGNSAPVGEEKFQNILHDFKEITGKISLIIQK